MWWAGTHYCCSGERARNSLVGGDTLMLYWGGGGARNGVVGGDTLMLLWGHVMVWGAGTHYCCSGGGHVMVWWAGTH